MGIPPVKDYRKHLSIVLRYCHAALVLTKLGRIKSVGYEELIDEKELESLADRLAAADPTILMPVSFEEILMTYTCFDFMNKILVSEYDEVITSTPPKGRKPLDFKRLRDDSLFANTHLMEDSMKKFGAFEEMTARKDMLAKMMF